PPPVTTAGRCATLRSGSVGLTGVASAVVGRVRVGPAHLRVTEPRRDPVRGGPRFGAFTLHGAPVRAESLGAVAPTVLWSPFIRGRLGAPLLAAGPREPPSRLRRPRSALGDLDAGGIRRCDAAVRARDLV